MVSRRNATFFIDGHLNQDFNGQVSPRFSVLKAAVGLYICLMLIVNLSACSAPERRGMCQ
jgi:hypothetical protein